MNTVFMILRKSFYPIAFLLFLFVPELLTAQEAPPNQPETIDVFMDCRGWNCRESYIRDEITFVNYVRNKDEADLHILVTEQQTGSGGEEFTIEFIGHNDFSDLSRTLTYFSAESDTEDERRSGLNENIKRGLFFFIADHPVAENLNISYEPEEGRQDAAELDRWNYWVFELNADTDFEGEESEKEFSLRGGFDVERITPEMKLEFELDQYYERQTFRDDDTTRVFTTESRGADLLLVKSLSDHWSVGVTSDVRSSTRNNLDLLTDGGLAVEYSIFPYEEFTRRQITILYGISGGYRDYIDRTIYDKTSEYLLEQELRTNIEFTQPWGEFETQINGSTYLHDLNKNRLDTEMQLNFRIYRGLSIYVSGEYAWIHNQLSIPAGDITDAEQLLNLRERFTSYSYEVRFGVEFTFGSIYNNIVNPRM